MSNKKLDKVEIVLNQAIQVVCLVGLGYFGISHFLNGEIARGFLSFSLLALCVGFNLSLDAYAKKMKDDQR